MAYVKLEDEFGRIIHVPVFNESEDGSGSWHVPVCDANGYLKVAMQSIKKLKYGAEADLTIASGVIAVTQTYHSIIVQGGAGGGNDQLDTATGGSEGDILILKSNTSGGSDTVTVANGTGSDTFILAGGANFVFDHIDDRLMCIHNGTEWVELSRSSNS